MKTDLMVKAIARLGQVDIVEAFIEPGRGEGAVHGLWEPETNTRRPRITINPSHHIVDTLIHEALHELHPHWSERYVRVQTKRIMKAMTDDQVWTLYAEYRRRIQRETE